MSAKSPEPSAKDAPKPKGKGKLIVIIVAVLVLAGGGGGAWFFMNNANKAADETTAPAPARAAAPTYMALENLVVNLADGERFAQIGITLDLDSEKTAEKVKALQPTIRSKILMMVSQRTAEELLKRDGKEKLATDIANEVSGALGFEVEDAEPAAKPAKATQVAEADGEDDQPPVRKKKKKKAAPASPVHGVLFSAFIVQ